jgi:predicted amidohydrolase
MRPGDDVAENLARITLLVRQAKLEDKADLVVFPELVVSGLTDPGARAQAVPGPVTDQLCRLAAELKMYLVVGVAERGRDAIYNSACLIGPEGLVAVYRKTHLMESERAWASPGDDWVVADTPVGRIGLLIGHDASFPEAGRILALRGCDLIVCVAAMTQRFSTPHSGSLVPQNDPIPTGADPYHWHHFRVRAGENNVFFAFSNVFDPADGYPGLSGVFGPDTFEFPRREAIAPNAEGTTTVVVDTTNLDTVYPTNIVRRKDLVAMRMPHSYRALIRKVTGDARSGEPMTIAQAE